jgi:hypothetical protein
VEPEAAGRSVVVKPFTIVAVAFLVLIAIVHLLRLFTGWEVVVVGFVIPVWWSAIGAFVAGGLALMVWREVRK